MRVNCNVYMMRAICSVRGRLFFGSKDVLALCSSKDSNSYSRCEIEYQLNNFSSIVGKHFENIIYGNFAAQKVTINHYEESDVLLKKLPFTS